MSFVVFGLPRSRTAWLSRFLTYGEWMCAHEELRHLRSLDDVQAWFSQPCIGTAETAAAPWWRMLPTYAPDAKVLVVRRPVDEVVESLMRLQGVAFDRPTLERVMGRLDRKLGQIEKRLPGVLSVKFQDLEHEATCAAVFEHCLPYRHDRAHWARLAPANIQVSMPGLMRYMAAYQPQLDKLTEVAKHRTLAMMSAKQANDIDGLTFQTEDFEDWLRDGPPLFEEHCTIVGERPSEWRRKNIPMMRALNDLGCMQVMTARCNGRMFGYLMTIISPSLTSADVLTATHTTFFASPSFPGLGMKLQREALKPLRARGVDEVFMQAGVRGSGERISAIYKRMGAENNGQFFRLELTEH